MVEIIKRVSTVQEVNDMLEAKKELEDYLGWLQDKYDSDPYKITDGEWDVIVRFIHNMVGDDNFILNVDDLSLDLEFKKNKLTFSTKSQN